jgi:dimethylhistidine N-methyltransferase
MTTTRAPLPVLDFAPRADSFLGDVLRGLRRRVKTLPCKYFYDERGSRLFDRICDLPEYYLTRTELAIMRRHAGDMAETLGPRCLLVEFGSGSGRKTRLLLDHLRDPAAYVPLDISREHLLRSARALAARSPRLPVLPVCADFTARFELPVPPGPVGRTAVYFPGSTVGNFSPRGTTRLLRRIARLVGPGGGLLIGTDLQKGADVLEPAYDDRQGVTAEFNRNLLRRINRELGADFPVEAFRHRAWYNEAKGRVEMHLVCERHLAVRVGGAIIEFAAGEGIRTECSYKYTFEGFRSLAAAAGMEVRQTWTDDARLFSVQYLEAV